MSFDCVFGVTSNSPTDLLAFAFNNILLRSKFYVIPLAGIWMAGHMKGGEWGFLLFNYAVFFVRVHFSLFIFLQPNCFKPKGKLGFPVAQRVKNMAAIQETQEMWVRYLGWKDPLEEQMAIHFSILAQKVPWTEEPDSLQSRGSQESYTTERLHVHALKLLNHTTQKTKASLFAGMACSGLNKVTKI